MGENVVCSLLAWSEVLVRLKIEVIPLEKVIPPNTIKGSNSRKFIPTGLRSEFRLNYTVTMGLALPKLRTWNFVLVLRKRIGSRS